MAVSHSLKGSEDRALVLGVLPKIVGQALDCHAEALKIRVGNGSGFEERGRRESATEEDREGEENGRGQTPGDCEGLNEFRLRHPPGSRGQSEVGPPSA